MATKKGPAGPVAVTAFTHDDKRTNIPTADAHDFVTPEVEEVLRVKWEQRDLSLDPQLVWRGKDIGASALETDVPPIYIQEKIDPRVLVENLRNTSKANEPEPELTLFETFDGLGELDLVDFYRHDANWSNRMILGDSLQVMGSLAEREGLRGKVQMIYIDPPYGIKFGSNWQVSTRKRDVKDGKLEDATFEAEQIKAFRDTWELGIHSYLSYLRDRLLVARDLLTESGSCFVQIGDENVHLVRSLMDEVFGAENFVSTIAFKTTSGAGSFSGGTNVLAGVFDCIVWYSRDKAIAKYRQVYSEKTAGVGTGELYRLVRLPDGNERRATSAELGGEESLPPGARFFRPTDLTSQTTRTGQTTVFPVEVGGRTYRPRTGGWKTNRVGMSRLLMAGRIRPTKGDSIQYVRFLDDFPASPISNFWADTQTGSFTEDKIYVVQTNTKVIERCMLMCTDPGDLVIDPTCGSGTTAHVAEQWGRRWITIDTSRVSLALARQRLMGARFPYYLLADTPEGRKKEAELTGQVSAGGATSGDLRRGFVYERVQHITLKSIANNPDIVDGMTRAEIDAAIKRHADFEMLYDKPHEDRHKVRVTGPFTVESLSPHRSIAFSAQPIPSEAAAAVPEVSFEQTILERLATAGVQNGKRNERLRFESIEPHAGSHVQAVGARLDPPDETRPKVAVVVGPQYGTVGPSFIKAAVKEANAIDGVGLLCVLAFAFDPNAVNATEDYLPSTEGFDVADERSFGRVRVLLVRMNSDLLMGELKNTDKGNLFTVFGEPDIDVRQTDDGVVVEIRGVDVYDPTTGAVRSSDPDKVALWMIDTDYNEESFFVRHCYFTGGNDPYARLKKALKADIDEDAWASLNCTVSRPFPPPTTGKIAVKVINDYGDEVMKVIEL